MEWTTHRKWARKLGISDEVSEYVDLIIDAPDESDLPPEYKDQIANHATAVAAENGAAAGNTGLSLVITKEALKHDAGRQKRTKGDLAAECILRVLRQTGDEYVKAWYLHHHLDYISENRHADAGLTALTRRYEREYPKAHSQEITQFLMKHQDELASDIGRS